MNTKSDSKQVVRTLGQRLTIMAILGLVVITVLFGVNQIVQRAANVPPGNGQGTGSGAIAQDVSVWTQTSKYDFDRGLIYQVDTSANPGDVVLAIKMQTVLDHFNDQRYINSEESQNISVEDGEVELLPLRSEGVLVSKNLFPQHIVRLESFNYEASIPWRASVKVQFSKDGVNWYSSAGTLDGWDKLSEGSHDIDLSNLNWVGVSEFYYRMAFDGGGLLGFMRPAVKEVELTYAAYHTSGIIASMVFDSGVENAQWDSICWDATLSMNATITFEVRASDTFFTRDSATPGWTSVEAEAVSSNSYRASVDLPSGRYKQWRATLSTSDTSTTPVLHEVRVYYY